MPSRRDGPVQTCIEKEFLVKKRPLFLIIALAGASALSCASQSRATTTAPASEHSASPAQAPEQQAAPAPATAPPPGQPGAQAQAAEAVVTPAQVAWADMTKPQRGKYMASVVAPRMKEVFRTFDSKRFAEFGCKTCHGQSAKERGFEMPNPELTTLPSTKEGWAKLTEDEPELMKFMSQTVKPEMAKLLGMKEYDPTNPQPGTVGCNRCHTVKSN
jgi:hypothetical protein